MKFVSVDEIFEISVILLCVSFEKICLVCYNFRTMSEDGEYVVGGRPLGDPTPPMVPLDAGPGHQAQHARTIGLCVAGPGR